MSIEEKEAAAVTANDTDQIPDENATIENETANVADTTIENDDEDTGEQLVGDEDMQDMPEIPEIQMGKDATKESIVFIDLDEIDCRIQSNAREENSAAYSDLSIRSLAMEIISANTLLHPLVIYRVKPSDKTDGKSYKLNAGFRRSKALRMAHEITSEDKYIKAPFVWAKVFDVNAEAAKKIGGQAIFKLTQIMENIREDLEPLETAKAIEGVIKESRGSINQEDIAKQLGVSPGKISQYLKILEAPEPFKKRLAEGKISFSHVREVMSPVYLIDPNMYDTLAKIAEKWSYENFKNHLIKNHLRDKGNEGTDDTTKPEKATASTAKIKNVFIPFLKLKVEKLNEKSAELKKEYTALDIEKARLDAIASTLNDQASLSKEVQPFEEELNKQAEEEKKQKASGDAYAKFISDQAKAAKNLLDLPINDETGERPYPSLTSAIAEIHKRILAMKPEELAAINLDIKDEAKRAEVLKQIHQKFIENKKLARERAAAAKAAKEKKKAEGGEADGEKETKTKKRKAKKSEK